VKDADDSFTKINLGMIQEDSREELVSPAKFEHSKATEDD